MIIGITGGIACGKSTISTFLKTNGYPVIDADLVARAVVEPGSQGLTQIAGCFGRDILLADGSLNRVKLGKLVFRDADAMKKLTDITNPLIFQEVLRRLKQAEQHAPLVFLDGATLVESPGYLDLLDQLWLVVIDPQIQKYRLMARNQMNQEDAEARINSQWSTAKKMKYADLIIDNNGSMEQTLEQVRQQLDLIFHPEQQKKILGKDAPELSAEEQEKQFALLQASFLNR